MEFSDRANLVQGQYWRSGRDVSRTITKYALSMITIENGSVLVCSENESNEFSVTFGNEKEMLVNGFS